MYGIIGNSVIASTFFLTYKQVRQFKCSQNKAPDHTEFYRWFHNCRSPVCDLIYITIVALRIGMWCPDFWKICSVSFYTYIISQFDEKYPYISQLCQYFARF